MKFSHYSIRFPDALKNFLCLLALASLLPTAPASDKADAPPGDADTLWRQLQHDYDTPPQPLKQPPDRMLTPEEIAADYNARAELAGRVADHAKDFFTRFPAHPQADEARKIYFNMLHTAVELSSTNKIPELESATNERLKVAGDEPARLQLSLWLLHSAVSGREMAGDAAMRAELEKRARQLAKDYPTHPDGCNYLLNLARAADPEKSAALAREILQLSPTQIVKEECIGIIARSAALGKPLDWKLALSDGNFFDLKKQTGHPVFLFFWDTESRFSGKAIWAVNELYKKFHADGLEVMGLNFDSGTNTANLKLQELNIVWPQYFDAEAGWKIRRDYGVHFVPLCWLVDKKGVLRELKAEQSPEVLVKKLLAE